jgi:2-phosphosulfolactate phosphatase
VAEVQVLHLVEGARQATGLTVILDVLRAMSVACYAMSNNPSAVFPVGELDAALRLRESHPNTLLIGEREGQRLPAFDFVLRVEKDGNDRVVYNKIPVRWTG